MKFDFEVKKKIEFDKDNSSFKLDYYKEMYIGNTNLCVCWGYQF